MNHILSEILRNGRVKSPDGKLINVHSSITREEGDFLQEIISEIKPKDSLEVGLAYGVSALFICDAINKKANYKHIVIDPNQFGGAWGNGWDGIGINNLKEAGYADIIEFYNMPSHHILPKLAAEGRKIDFAFIDGWHTFDHTLLDFFYIDEMLRTGGVIAIDDTDMTGIKKVCRFILKNRSYSVYRCYTPLSKHKFSLRRYILDGIVHLSESIRGIINNASVDADASIGLIQGSTCIAFRKDADDSRAWDFHNDF